MITIKQVGLRLLASCVTTLITVMLAEWVCRWGGGEGVRLIRDPDHRLPKNTADTNTDGIRCAREAADFRAGDLNIIVIGDSFTYGYGVPRDDAFPQQFEKLCRKRVGGQRVNVANMGWTSASPYLELRLLKDIGRKYKPAAVFMCYDMTDFHDDIKYRHLLERDRWIYQGARFFPGLTLLLKKSVEKLKLDRLHERLFDLPRDRFFCVNQPLAVTRPRFATTFAALRETEQFVRTELHAKFVLLVLPRAFQYSRNECPNSWERDAYTAMGPYARDPFVFFEKVKPTVSYPIYSLLETFATCGVFPTCQQNDPHWNRAGHRIAAQALYDIARTEGVVPQNPVTNAPSARAP